MKEGLDSCVLGIKTRIGILPVELLKLNNDDYRVTMTQGSFELGPPLGPGITGRLLGALGMEKSNLDSRCPVQVASTGHSKVMIGIKDRKKLNGLCPDLQHLAMLSKLIDCNGYFAFTFDTDTPGALVTGRMFAPAIGISEDPVTGTHMGRLADI